MWPRTREEVSSIPLATDITLCGTASLDVWIWLSSHLQIMYISSGLSWDEARDDCQQNQQVQYTCVHVYILVLYSTCTYVVL